MRSGPRHRQTLAIGTGPGSAYQGQEGRVAACLGTASPTPLRPSLPPQRHGRHSLREAVGGCQHPVSGEQGAPTEVCSIVTKTDLPRPPAQAGVLATHDAIDGQLPMATVCGRGGSQGQWEAWTPCLRGSERSCATLRRVSGHDPNLRGLRDVAPPWGRVSEETQPPPWGPRGTWLYQEGREI